MADQIKAIIFDMGGVILRTEDYTSRKALAKRFGMTCEELEMFVFTSPSSMQATVGKISDEQHWQNVWLELKVPKAEQADFEKAFWDGDIVDQKLVTFLRSQKGKYSTALLSNAWTNARKTLTYYYHCIDAFDMAIFSCEVGLAKPDPAIYRLVLDRLGVCAEESIFVDDIKVNIQAAVDLGFHGIQFHNTDDALAKIEELLAA
jgi:epoxide hydrolase-like predicted phosphatase